MGRTPRPFLAEQTQAGILERLPLQPEPETPGVDATALRH